LRAIIEYGYQVRLSAVSIVPNKSNNPLEADLNFILLHASESFEKLRGKRIFITGGTGFFGTWLLESFVWCNRALELNATAVVLTRNIEQFHKKAPHLASADELSLFEGDIRDFQFPAGNFDFIIHAATESGTSLNETDPSLMIEAIVQGTKRMLAFAAECNCHHFLFTSSGAVYGPQPTDVLHIPESYCGAPNTLLCSSAYAEGKRLAELLIAISARNSRVKYKIARCFAFVGPHLPINAHFAIGNFIRDGLTGDSISIQGDGTACRSYLYASDLMIWLWTILAADVAFKAYNVGSEESFSIREVANAVSAQFSPTPEVLIAKKADPDSPVNRYIPSTKLIRDDLALRQRVTLTDAIAKTIAWHRK